MVRIDEQDQNPEEHYSMSVNQGELPVLSAGAKHLHPCRKPQHKSVGGPPKPKADLP